MLGMLRLIKEYISYFIKFKILFDKFYFINLYSLHKLLTITSLSYPVIINKLHIYRKVEKTIRDLAAINNPFKENKLKLSTAVCLFLQWNLPF